MHHHQQTSVPFYLCSCKLPIKCIPFGCKKTTAVSTYKCKETMLDNAHQINRYRNWTSHKNIQNTAQSTVKQTQDNMQLKCPSIQAQSIYMVTSLHRTGNTSGTHAILTQGIFQNISAHGLKLVKCYNFQLSLTTESSMIQLIFMFPCHESASSTSEHLGLNMGLIFLLLIVGSITAVAAHALCPGDQVCHFPTSSQLHSSQHHCVS